VPRRDLTSIQELLPSVLGKLAREGKSASSLKPVWEQIVGPTIARNATPLFFDQDALVISVASAGWALELQQREPEIRSRLAAVLGDKVVARLAFRFRA
jgi:hypothetical protein